MEDLETLTTRDDEARTIIHRKNFASRLQDPPLHACPGSPCPLPGGQHKAAPIGGGPG